MNFFQDYKYREALKSTVLALDDFLVNASIHHEQDAVVSPFRFDLEEVFPYIQCLEKEVNFKYDLPLTPLSAEDKAAKAYCMIDHLAQEMGDSSWFDMIPDEIQYNKLDVSKQIADLSSSFHEISDPNEQKIALNFLSLMQKAYALKFQSMRENTTISVREKIEENNLSDQIADSIGLDKNNEEILILIDDCLTESFLKSLQNKQNICNSLETASQIYDRLGKRNIPDFNELVSATKLVSYQMSEIIREDDYDYPYCLQQLDYLKNCEIPIEASDFYKLILNHHYQHLKEIKNPASDVLKDYTQKVSFRDFSFPDLTYAQKDNLSQMVFCNQNSQQWNNYETFENPKVTKEMQTLCKNISYYLFLGVYTQDKKVLSFSPLVRFSQKVDNLWNYEENVPHNEALNVIFFTSVLQNFEQVAQKYSDFPAQKVKFSPEILDEMKKQDIFYSEDFSLINDYLHDFMDRTRQYQSSSLQEKDFSDYSFLKEIQEMPKCQQKYDAINMLASFVFLKGNHLKQLTSFQKEITNQVFRKENLKDYQNLQDQIEMASLAFPEIKKVGIENLSSLIDSEVVQKVLVPLHIKEKLPSTIYLPTNLFENMSTHSTKAILQIAADYAEKERLKHTSLLYQQETPFGQEISNQIFFENKALAYDKKANILSSLVMESQKDHEVYSKFKKSQNKFKPQPFVNKELIISKGKSYN